MMEKQTLVKKKTGIEWTDATWNPVRGCSRVSEGCRNCYAEKQAARIVSMDRGRLIPVGQGSYDGLLASGGQWNGTIKLVVEKLYQPLQWQKPRKIFVNSMSDLFHDGVPDSYIDQVFAVMAAAEQHTFQILTKRPERMLKYMTDLKNRIDDIGKALIYRKDGYSYRDPDSVYDHVIDRAQAGFPNVWLGVSVEDQATADERIPLLLQTPAAIRWISAEPLLGQISLRICWIHLGCGYGNAEDPASSHCWKCSNKKSDMCAWPSSRIDWVVVGGESGTNARPLHQNWVRSLQLQCKETNTAFLFKQWGEYLPDSQNPRVGHIAVDSESHHAIKVGKKAAGRLLDGVLHDAYPLGGA